MTPYVFAVPLYPRSASVLLEILERPDVTLDYGLHPQYVCIDIDNFRNQLIAHLQRVALGDDGSEQQEEREADEGEHQPGD